MNGHRHQHGFTLIELAIVLVIIGLLAGSFITALSSRLDATRIAETRDQIELARQAILGFAWSQAPGPVRIPCPDCNNAACASGANVANDGIEDVSGGGACDAANQPGNLPWQTLGVGRSDAWGAHFSYWASNAYASIAGFNLASPVAGGAQINDTTGAGASTITSRVAAVIFSHGKDGYDAIGENGVAREAMPAAAAYNDQRENSDADPGAMLFISRPISAEGANIVYDDILEWITPFELKAQAVKAEVLP